MNKKLARAIVGALAFSPCVLFLQQEFLDSKESARRVVRNRLLPRGVRTRAAFHGIRRRPTIVLNRKWRHQQKMFRKGWYFLTSGLRYLL